jgi:hypothetical protein
VFEQPIEIREQQTTAHGLDERNQGLPALGIRGMLQQGTPQTGEIGRKVHG